MVVSYEADAFTGPARKRDPDNAWEVEGEIYKINPRYLVPDYAWNMLNLWHTLVSVSDSGGVSFALLPDAGGLMDQPGLMLDALNYLTFTHREIMAYRAEQRAAEAKRNR